MTADPTAQPTADPTADPTAQPTAKPTTADPTAQPSAKPTAKPTFRVLDLAAPTAEKTECLTAKGDWEGLTENHCGTCCPACTPVDASSFESNFDKSYFTSSNILIKRWMPKASIQGCVCVDLVKNDLAGVNVDRIDLGPSSDCVRFTGDDFTVLGDPWGGSGHDAMYGLGNGNNFWGQGGNDALSAKGNNNVFRGGAGDDVMYSDGTSNQLGGNEGNDELTMDGADGRFFGAEGNDVCTDLGDNDFSPHGQETTCETCFGPGEVELDCAIEPARF